MQQACHPAWSVAPANLRGKHFRSMAITLWMFRLLLTRILLWWSVAQLCMKAPIEFGGNCMRKRRCRWMFLSAKHNEGALGEAKLALSIAFWVADVEKVFWEQERASTQWRMQLQRTVGCARRSVVNGFALLWTSSLKAGPMTASVWRYTVTVGSHTVDLTHLAFLAAWVSPGGTEGNRDILRGEVGLDDQCSVYAEQIKISLALAGMAGADLSTKSTSP